MEKQTKKNPFKSVSENLPFWPNTKEQKEGEKIVPFTGVYVDTMVLGDSPKVEDRIPVYVFAEIETGEHYFVTQSYAITKAVNTAKEKNGTLTDIVFNFIYKGKTMNKNGKPFNQIDTSYCTLAEYLVFTGATEEAEEEKPKAKKTTK
jgi:hypothetical protein